MYRLLLRVWPAEFRERFGPSAVRDFEALHADAVEEGHAAVIRLWLRTIWTVVAGGIAERRSGRAERSGRGSWLADVVRDARLAMRSMRRSPGFAATTVLVVGLGVGATTTIFSAVDTVLLRPLPYPDSERLVTVRKASSLVPIPDYAAIRDRTHAFEILGAAWGISVDLTGGGAPERAPAALVSAGFFDLLGVTAARGRLFSPEEYGPGVADVAVISSSLWFRRWGGDPDIVGRTITLQGSPVTVIGVLDAGFIAPEALGLAGMDVSATRPDASGMAESVLVRAGRDRTIASGHIRRECACRAERAGAESCPGRRARLAGRWLADRIRRDSARVGNDR
jgi:hypothetical protein